MTKSQGIDPEKEFSSITDYYPDKKEIDELRQIIFGLTKPELENLQAWLKDERAFICDIEEAIPDVIKNLIEAGELKSNDVIPFVEEAIEKSIQNNPQKFADILFPVMMPAIRKAIAESISNMLDSLNSTLENGFSPKRIGWRFRSIFGSESYAEIVLSNAYIFQVKQIFLIHKESGLLLHEVKSGTAITKDVDMVSGMLTAIQDFVKDSLTIEGERSLDTIRISGYNIWLEYGPHAIIAGIVEGTPPNNLRENFKNSIEKIHIDYSKHLQKFEGETTPFQKTESQLASCLQEQKKPEKIRPPYIIYFLLILILGFIGYKAYRRTEKQLRWNKYIQRISAEPGVIVSNEGYKKRKFFVSGIKDPQANDPLTMLKTFGFADTVVNSYWVLFYSLEQEFIIKRTRNALNLPDSVEISYYNDTLFVRGSATTNHLDEASIKALNLPGVRHIVISGFATPAKEINIGNLEEYSFDFAFNSTELSYQEKSEYNLFIQKLKSYLDSYNSKGQQVNILVNSYTSHKGNSYINSQLANTRAVNFINLLERSGIYRNIISYKIIYVDETPVPFRIRSISIKLFVL